ncbi:hypothetical protein DXG03_006654 [Asterophora parasitica]|uniref:SAP domain-containing protein n=1 Tax=Asterophora parasitica TaxID=117018 RepID=A0A9P7GDY3_9AGAR|nr:hypothetical protein DXG03_006654 [Asterophora parasitica]
MLMFRVVPAVARSRLVTRRTFVSSVLLTRSWENESVAELRKELKNRGLAQKGNKATLILRIQEYDQTKTLEALAPVPANARHMSAAAAPAADSEGVAPGIPPAAHTPATASNSLNINIPNLWQPVPEIPVQIPYVPDFWDSSATATRLQTDESPVLLVVAGADTHLSGGPSHKLVDENADLTSVGSPQAAHKREKVEGGIWDDVADDIGFARPKELQEALSRVFWRRS